MRTSTACPCTAISRRSFLRRTAMTAAIAATPLELFGNADAADTQAHDPGFFKLSLGDFQITALSDGLLEIPADKVLVSTNAGEIQTLLHKAHLQSVIKTSVNQFLIDTGSKIVLVDAGAGTFLGPSLGRLITHLRAAGYEPEQVDEVLITHLHVDHVGGLSRNGKMVFANATVRVHNNDLSFWLDDTNAGKVSEENRVSFEPDRLSLAPYIASGRVEPFDAYSILMPGITAVAAYGHTPGHTAFKIESKGNELLLFGDTIHTAAIQFPDPAVTVIWDLNPKRAEAQREKILRSAATRGFLAAGAHIAFPGIGHVGVRGNGYVWVPVKS